MASLPLERKHIAILATDGFEQSELMQPRQALIAAGASTVVVSPKPGKIKGWSGTNWGESVDVDLLLSQADVDDFDALVLPGGVMNPDHLRTDAAAVSFVQAFARAGKPIAAICHGPWLLVEAGLVRGKTLTSWPSLQTDISNAGGAWVDQQVASDGGIITSRNPQDIPAFNEQIIKEIAAATSPSQARNVPLAGTHQPK